MPPLAAEGRKGAIWKHHRQTPMTVQHPTFAPAFSDDTSHLTKTSSASTTYLSIVYAFEKHFFPVSQDFGKHNWNHPFKDKHLLFPFHLFLKIKKRTKKEEIFPRCAPGGWASKFKQCRRRRRRSVQVSSRDFLQTITFGNTLLSNLLPPSLSCVMYIMRLSLEIFLVLNKEEEDFIFSSEIFPSNFL